MRWILDKSFRAYCPLGAVLIVFLVIEIFLFRYHSYPQVLGETDGIGYMDRAAGPLFQADAFHGPGYSWAIRLGMMWGFSPFGAAKTISLVFGVLFIFVSWRFFLAMSGPKEAFWGTVLLAFNPTILARSVYVMSDMLAVGLFMSALALLLLPSKSTIWPGVLAGVLGGLAYLTRYVYIIIVVLPVIFWFFRLLAHNERQKNLISLLCFYLGFVGITLPWFIFLYQVKGNPFWNHNHLNIALNMYIGTLGWHGPPPLEDFPNLLAVIRSDPRLFFQSWAGGFLYMPWRMLQYYPETGVIAAVGFFCWLAQMNRIKMGLLLTILLYSLAVSVLWLSDRFVLLLFPLVAACMVSGLFAIPKRIYRQNLSGRLGRGLGRIPLRLFAFGVVGLFLPFSAVRKIPGFFADQALEYQRAAEYLRATAPAQSSILTAKPHIPYYSDMQCLDYRSFYMQKAQLEDLPGILEQARPDFFIYDQRYAQTAFEQFEVFLEPRRNPYPDLLQCVHQIETPKKVVIYKYLK